MDLFRFLQVPQNFWPLLDWKIFSHVSFTVPQMYKILVHQIFHFEVFLALRPSNSMQIEEFVTLQILCEINRWKLKRPKIANLTISEALDCKFWNFCLISSAEIYQNWYLENVAIFISRKISVQNQN